MLVRHYLWNGEEKNSTIEHIDIYIRDTRLNCRPISKQPRTLRRQYHITRTMVALIRTERL